MPSQDLAVLFGQLDAVRVQDVRSEEVDALEEGQRARTEAPHRLLTVVQDFVRVQAQPRAALVGQSTRGAQAVDFECPRGTRRKPHALGTVGVEQSRAVRKLIAHGLERHWHVLG